MTGPGRQASEAEPRELDAFYRRHFVTLTRLAVILLGDPAAASDTVQDVFIAVHRRWHQFATWPEPRLLAYLRRSVLNGVRSAKRRHTVASAHRPEPLVAAQSAEATVLTRLAGAQLRAHLIELPRRQREVIALRYLADLSTADTAATLGISVSAVTSSTTRGLDALRSAMGVHQL